MYVCIDVVYVCIDVVYVCIDVVYVGTQHWQPVLSSQPPREYCFNVYKYMHTHKHICTYIYTHTHIYINMCMYVCMYMYIPFRWTDSLSYLHNRRANTALMCINICTHTNIYIYIYIYTDTHTHIYIHVCMYVCMYMYIPFRWTNSLSYLHKRRANAPFMCVNICIHTSIHIHIHIYVHTHTHIHRITVAWIPFHVCKYMHTHIYIHIHIYIHTYVYVYTPFRWTDSLTHLRNHHPSIQNRIHKKQQSIYWRCLGRSTLLEGSTSKDWMCCSRCLAVCMYVCMRMCVYVK